MGRFIVKQNEDGSDSNLIFDTVKQITVAVGLAPHHTENVVTALNGYYEDIERLYNELTEQHDHTVLGNFEGCQYEGED